MTEVSIDQPGLSIVPQSTWTSPWRRPTVIGGMIVAVFWLIVVFTVQWWAPYGPLEAVGKRLQPPNGHHWLGTDALSRDVFTRTLYGARQTLPVSVAVIVSAVSIGTVLGSIAGFVGGRIESVIMRLVDITLAFPPIFLAMAVAAALGSGLRNAFFAMVIVWWPIYARLIRGQVQAVKHRDHIQAAVSIGATRTRILRKHVLPLSFTPALISATLDLGQVVILTATLSFLGLGAKPPSPEWGAMITDGARFFYQWWVAVAPGLAILTVGMAFNFLGDGLRDALDVRAKR
ncbi:MAG: peptide/nickel transport system permease protein [Ilumatobacteraceae bacterium]|jgi:peptide/nickel transport system permease protein